MAFKPGHAKVGGRKRGAANKQTADLRDMILTALHGAGGAKYLQEQAAASPAAFLSLVGRLLPKDVKLDATVGHKYVMAPPLAGSLAAWQAGIAKPH